MVSVTGSYGCRLDCDYRVNGTQCSGFILVLNTGRYRYRSVVLVALILKVLCTKLEKSGGAVYLLSSWHHAEESTSNSISERDKYSAPVHAQRISLYQTILSFNEMQPLESMLIKKKSVRSMKSMKSMQMRRPSLTQSRRPSLTPSLPDVRPKTGAVHQTGTVHQKDDIENVQSSEAWATIAAGKKWTRQHGPCHPSLSLFHFWD